MSHPTIHIPLSNPFSDRWNLSTQQIEWAKQLVISTLDEIDGSEPYLAIVERCFHKDLPDAIKNELTQLAELTGHSFHDVLTANLYYDLVKHLLGCTAFAVNTPSGPVLARNMDWISQNNQLAEFTTIVHFESDRPFQSIGWPGFVGVFSGLAPGRFAVTMNAALSDQPQMPGHSVPLMIRQALETCNNFDEAVTMLSQTPLSSDCLLLVTGTEHDQMTVIERTPRTSAHRNAKDGFLIVTNDFRILPQSGPADVSPLYSSTCSRFDGTAIQLQDQLPQTLNECFEVLNDDRVRMQITVQQMAMSAATGMLEVQTS